MPNLELFNQDGHVNTMIDEGGSELAVQSNQHLIVHNGEGMILDPGGHKVYAKVLSETFVQLGGGKLKYIFLSHQDPDIVAAVNGWLMTTDAEAQVSALWERFVPHFGLDALVASRLKTIPDEGTTLNLGGLELLVIPAHFLHSCGNFQVYDPVSKILYTGDLGASVGLNYQSVTDFDAHLVYMEGFHQRYMANNKVMKMWADMVGGLDIETIAPQHGAVFQGRELVDKFIDWAGNLECGLDLMNNTFKLPSV